MVEAKKRFGQNFLKDKAVLDKIIKAMPNINEHELVEIGPGLGDLTERLLQIKSVTAFEVDNGLCEHLRDAFKDEIAQNKLDLHEIDVLEYWKENSSLKNKSYWLIANLPYYITTPILQSAFEDKNCVGMVVMVQYEVAQKLVAKCETSEFSLLSILAQSFGSVNILFSVPKDAFKPSPKVESAVVFIKRDTQNKDIKNFKSYLKKAFVSPRKTIYKNLSGAYDKNIVNKIFEELEIKQNTRAHQLSSDTHCRLFNKLNQK